uniref:Uncharacterized protein n=1 Tax=viral metagenome TaxID=1070528 RepID=A0A6C0D871_9ZZZZ
MYLVDGKRGDEGMRYREHTRYLSAIWENNYKNMYIYNVYKMSIVTLAYNPNDFFYATSYNTPSDDVCTQWNTNHTDFSNCDTQSWVDASVNCFKYKLCKNKELATLANSAKDRYNGSDERYANIKKEYDYAVLHTVNIVTGIVALSGLTVYYFYK